MRRQWLLGKGDSDFILFFFFNFFKSVAHVRSTRVPWVVSHTGLTRKTKIQTNGLLLLKREKKVVKFCMLEDKVDQDELRGKFR